MGKADDGGPTGGGGGQTAVLAPPTTPSDDERKGRHGFQTKAALILAATTLLLVGSTAVLSSGASAYLGAPERTRRPQRRPRLLEGEGGDGDYSSHSCNDLYTVVPDAGSDRCDFARTCNGGDGTFASFVFCKNDRLSEIQWCLALSPALLLWLVVLFRMLGSTAEDFFSPSLEMFSVRMGLPPRFAGVTLLALGNGAADVSATVNAIVSDPDSGYEMSLGALTGAGMFVGTVVAGIVIVTADGVRCRGALVRDVVMFILTLVVVFVVLKGGSIGAGAVSLFFSMYAAFVIVVLIADVYHRAVVLPRSKANAEKLERERQLEEGRRAQAAAAAAAASELEITKIENEGTEMDITYDDHNASIRIVGTEDSKDEVKIPIANRALNRILMALSNYDRSEVEAESCPADGTGWGTMDGRGVGLAGVPSVDENERVNLHGANGILNKHQHMKATLSRSSDAADGPGEPDEIDSPYSAMVDGVGVLDSMCTEDGLPGFSAKNWRSAWHDGTSELKCHCREVWDDIFHNEENGVLDKFLLAAELPFTIARKLTVPIPCEGYYNRALVALSIVISPVWLAIYFLMQFEVNLFFSNGLPWIAFLLVASTFVGVLVLRYAPGGDGVMALMVSVPIAFYGFCIAATWIDFIADKLVALLGFLGIVCRIPGSVMGLTVLAWGNSMGDLSANMTMARKGLANMAMTACFAGPVFNILIGLGWGFSRLNRVTGRSELEVSISPSVETGFFFLLCNCVLVIVSGVFWCKGTIPKGYGYIALGMYSVYIVTSFVLQFSS